MNRRRFYQSVVLGMAIAFAAPQWLAADEEKLPPAETILDHYVEVTGGKAAYDKHKSDIVTIEMEIVGRGIKGTLTRYNDTSNNVYMEGELEGIGKLEEGVYNGQAWENNAMTGPRLKEGTENADAVRDATFNGLVYWRKLYKAETSGTEKVGDEDCYKVTLTPLGEGKPQTMYFSKKTGLMVKSVRTVVTPMGEITADLTASDYERFGGVLMAKKMTQKVMGNEIALTVMGVKDEEIPKGRFDPPAEIKALMEKK